MKSGPLILPLPPLALVKALSHSPTFLGFRLCWVRLEGRGFLKIGLLSDTDVMSESMLFNGRATEMNWQPVPQ